MTASTRRDAILASIPPSSEAKAWFVEAWFVETRSAKDAMLRLGCRAAVCCALAMRLLVLGGTAFLGRQVAVEALGRGHEVTCLARGVSGEVADGARWVRADREAPDALAEIATQHWDALVDVSRQPGQVRRAAQALAATTAHAVYVSTCSVYADHSQPGADESAELLDPLDADRLDDLEQYGEAKVACEVGVLAAFGEDRSLLARAGLIGGPGDVSGRTGYWPWRLANPVGDGSAVLVPDAFGDPVQIIDVRDLAAWLVTGAERRLAGAANAVGEMVTFGEYLEACRATTGSSADLAIAGNAWLVEHDVQPWMGPRSLPLWLGGDPEWKGFGARSTIKAREQGLRTRPIAQTIADALAYEQQRRADQPRLAGLSDEDETALLAELRGQHHRTEA